MKHFTSDPAVGDMDNMQIAMGMVSGTMKIYCKHSGTIYVWDHDSTIT